MTHAKPIPALMVASVIAAFAFLVPSGVQARTQTDLNIAASRNAAKADAAMTAAYKKLMTALNPAQKTQLARAQKSWLNYRDAQAALLASGSKGGTMYPLVYASEATDMTQKRTRELQDAYQVFKDR